MKKIVKLNITRIFFLLLVFSFASGTTCISPDSSQGGRIAFISNRHDENWEFYVMNADGSNQKRLTYNEDKEKDASFSPHGSKIAFARNVGGSNWEIYLMNIDGSNEKRLTTDSQGNNHSPTFSGKGR